jgi:hypothetical protein
MGYIRWIGAFLPDDEYFDVLVNLAESWNQQHSQDRAVDAIDPPREGRYPGSRGPDQLVIYTPAYGHPSTGTNIWGTEAIVRRGKVTKVGDNNQPIPEDGFVISGHGTSSRWIAANIKKGNRVEYNTTRVLANNYFPDKNNSDEMIYLLWYGLMKRIYYKQTGFHPRDRDYTRLREFFSEIRVLEKQGDNMDIEKAKEILDILLPDPCVY